MYYFDAPKNLIIKNWLCHLFCKKNKQKPWFSSFQYNESHGEKHSGKLKSRKVQHIFLLNLLYEFIGAKKCVLFVL